MKLEKLRELNKEELERKLEELQAELFKLKIRVQTKQEENTSKLLITRKGIARCKTLLRALEIKALEKKDKAEKK